MQRSPAQLCLLFLAGVMSVFLLLGTWLGWLPFRPCEVIGLITGIASVVLAIRVNIWNFPTGMASNLCFIALFYSMRLYGIMFVQVVFFVLQAHGWFCWWRGTVRNDLPVSHVPRSEATVLMLIGIPATIGSTIYLRHVGDPMPFADALATVISLICQYMLNLKRAENWSLGAAVDVIYIAIYLVQKLHLTAVLYFFYLIFCILGYREWLNEIRARSAAECVIDPNTRQPTPDTLS